VPKQGINIFLTTKCLGYLFFIPLNQVQVVEGLKEKGIERSRFEVCLRRL
jgi:hypothetical protein